MPDMALIAGTVSSLKSAFDITKLLIGIRDATILNERVLELQQVIISAQANAVAAQSQQLTLLEQVSELKKQLAELEAWDAQKQRYELKKVAAGAIVYALKADASGSEPPHWICATCYQNRRISFMQERVTSIKIPSNGGTEWICPVCPTKIRIPFL
jgi:hypothetical protein